MEGGSNSQHRRKAPADLENGARHGLERRPRRLPLRDYQRLQRALRLLQLCPRRVAQGSAPSVTLAEAKLACDILERNGMRFVHFTGGEPLVHRDLTAMVAHAAQIGMIPTLVTNGALLTPQRIAALAKAGIAKV
jgi:Fe-coproporphyrin III synthase